MLLVYWYMYTKKCTVAAIIANRIERVGRDNSVGIEARWAEMSGDASRGEFSIPVQTGPGIQPEFNIMGTRSFLRVNWTGRGVTTPFLCSAEFKEIDTPV